ncbi:MAG TPA: hypothetical protein VJ784_08160 [Pyrinomonadaceae bacterium]|jgi:hypothetical protein|nr:hypothetical protein [Pyrinomonadaceae bacterium]
MAKLFAVAIILLTVVSASAQSIDPNAPSPVRNNSVTGRIAARDLGDARLTDHYYALRGTPGDLLITINSTNLNGDVDVFTATTLRPLLKLTLYAESTSPVTKGIYLRRREDLILRIEARSPNDDEGTYRLFFGGSFEPLVGGPEIAEAETPATEITTPGGRKTKRVSSVGARIEEPEPPVTEVATATPTPEPTPEATPEAKPVETPEAKPEKSPEVEIEKPAPVRNTRGRRPAGRRPAPRVRETPPPVATVEQPKPKPEPEPEVGPRLVIETNDGTLINRSMSTVRRVTVENGQVVVTGKDGKIDRILLVNVVRMSIAP